jgi:tetratricopeptide (TPR) repeat protein
MYRETAELLKVLGRERTADAVLLYGNWGSLRSDIGDIAGGVRLFEVALEIGRALRSDAAPDQFVNASYARRLLLLDRLDEAEQHFSQTRVLSDSEGDVDMEAIALLGLAAVDRERGDIQGARATLDTAGQFINAHFPAKHPARDSLLLETGMLHLASHSFNEAKSVLGQAIAGYARTKTHVPYQIVALVGVAQSELGLGNYPFAAARAAEASVMAGQFAVPGEPSYWVGYCLLEQADVEQALGNTASARAFAAKALLQLTPTVGGAHRVTKRAAAMADGIYSVTAQPRA